MWTDHYRLLYERNCSWLVLVYARLPVAKEYTHYILHASPVRSKRSGCEQANFCRAMHVLCRECTHSGTVLSAIEIMLFSRASVRLSADFLETVMKRLKLETYPKTFTLLYVNPLLFSFPSVMVDLGNIIDMITLSQDRLLLFISHFRTQ